MRFTSVLKKLIVENSRFKVLYDKMVIPSAKAIEKNPKAKGLMNFDILKQIIFTDPDTKAPENFDVEGASVEDMEQEKNCTTCKNKGFKSKHLNLIVLSVLISMCTLYGFVSIIKDFLSLFF